MKLMLCFVWACALLGFLDVAVADDLVVVRPREIDEVLTNPGIGFTTFHRFDGDPLKGGAGSEGHPRSSVAYFRFYWSDIEQEEGVFCWDVIDNALKGAREHGQTLMLRLAAHSHNRTGRTGLKEFKDEVSECCSPMPSASKAQHDVPRWYREIVGNDFEDLPVHKWSTDPEDPRFARYYGRLIREFGKRYDGHIDLESVDLAIIGAWGEGAGANLLTDKTCHALVDAYVESFKKTPLVALLMDARTNRYISSKLPAGWRADCLGDMGGFQPKWSHMKDRYPQALVKNGLQDAWKARPVNFEVCWVMQRWANKGWDIDYIIDESLKWHVSSVNAKSSPVPEAWWPNVNRWLKKMGYRFVMREFSYPAEVQSGGKLAFCSKWENKGVAPCYRQFPLALRLESTLDAKNSQTVLIDADICEWLPGEIALDREVKLPKLAAGQYTLLAAMVDAGGNRPKVQWAIEGKREDGWYRLGEVRVRAE